MLHLSSRATPFLKFMLPGGFCAAFPIFFFLPHRVEVFDYLAPILWGAACAVSIWWAAPVKKVSLEGDRFFISNYRQELKIPTSQLVRIKEYRWHRTPSIALFFDPPTAFGRKVRLIPPTDIWIWPIAMRRRQKFDRIAKLLNEILEGKMHNEG